MINFLEMHHVKNPLIYRCVRSKEQARTEKNPAGLGVIENRCTAAMNGAAANLVQTQEAIVLIMAAQALRDGTLVALALQDGTLVALALQDGTLVYQLTRVLQDGTLVYQLTRVLQAVLLNRDPLRIGALQVVLLNKHQLRIGILQAVLLNRHPLRIGGL